MKILIIGGNGFLGFDLVKKFYQKKYTITVLDKNLNNLDDFKKIKKIKSNFTNNKNLKKAVKNQDYVFHLAGISDLETAISHPMNVIKYNIEGTAKILQLCKINKVKRFIYASSIYAISQEGSFYRFSKRAAEDFIIEYSKNYNIDYTILRYGSLYGPKSPKTNSVRQAIEQAIKNEAIARQQADAQRQRESQALINLGNMLMNMGTPAPINNRNEETKGMDKICYYETVTGKKTWRG